MSVFSTDSTALGYVPRNGWLPVAGKQITGAHGYFRTWMQFLNGADMVDYSSLAVTLVNPLTSFSIDAIDTRCGEPYRGVAEYTQTRSDTSMEISYLESSSSTFLTDGFVEGDLVEVSGFIDPLCNGLFFVKVQAHIDAPGETGTYPNLLGYPTDPDTFTGEITETRLPLQRASQNTEALGSATTISKKNNTSMLSPSVGGQTWTLTALTPTVWSISGSVSGTLNSTYDMSAVGDSGFPEGIKFTDLLYLNISQGPVAASTGDVITFNTLDNPNSATNSPGSQWFDPEPNNGYLVPGTNLTREEGIPSAEGSSQHNFNLRPLHIDSAGVGSAADYIFIRLSVQDYTTSTTIDYLALCSEGFTGYEYQQGDGSQGGHPNPGPMVYHRCIRDVEYYGYLLADNRCIRPLILQSGEWVYGYIGLIDSYRTQTESPYPMVNAGSDNTTQNANTPSLQLVSGSYRSNSSNQIAAFYFNEDGVWDRIRDDVSTFTRPGIVALYPLYLVGPSQYAVQGSYAPPRLGDSQVPVMPITLPSQTSQALASKVNGATDNTYLLRRDAGQLRDVYCTSWNSVGEGDILNINGVDHLCIRGRWMDADTGISGFRMVYKLA
jgi:hypothetical protein